MISGYEDPRVVVSDKLDVVWWEVLADDRSPVVTGGVVPGSLLHRHAGLLAQTSGRSEPVRLATIATCLGPLVDPDDPDPVSVEADRPVGGQHLDQGGGPEPAVDIERLVVRSITATDLSITESASSPDLLDTSSCHEALHPAPLGFTLE